MGQIFEEEAIVPIKMGTCCFTIDHIIEGMWGGGCILNVLPFPTHSGCMLR